MPEFTQKYTIVHMLKDLPNGFEYSMKNWPLHVTIVDVFAVEGDLNSLLEDLRKNLDSSNVSDSWVTEEGFFGDDKSVHVMLVKKTNELQNLHDTIVEVLESYSVKFNSPQYTGSGFKPHATKQLNDSLKIGDAVKVNSVTLIDMFPDNDPYQRRVLGTIHF